MGKNTPQALHTVLLAICAFGLLAASLLQSCETVDTDVACKGIKCGLKEEAVCERLEVTNTEALPSATYVFSPDDVLEVAIGTWELHLPVGLDRMGQTQTLTLAIGPRTEELVSYATPWEVEEKGGGSLSVKAMATDCNPVVKVPANVEVLAGDWPEGHFVAGVFGVGEADADKLQLRQSLVRLHPGEFWIEYLGEDKPIFQIDILFSASGTVEECVTYRDKSGNGGGGEVREECYTVEATKL